MIREGQVRKEEGKLTSPSSTLGTFCPRFWGAGTTTLHSEGLTDPDTNLERGHYCPIIPCAIPSIHPKIPSSAARKTPVLSSKCETESDRALKARVSSSGTLIRDTAESRCDQSQLG